MSWRVLGSSVAGTVHVAAGRGCDDAHGWAVREDVTVIAIADGAGSRPGGAALGAHVAVRSALAHAASPAFADACADDAAAAASALVADVIAAVVEEAEQVGLAPTQLATTLCVAVLAPAGVTVVQVGDGIAVVERASGAVEVVAVAERFEYANETVFVTSADALAHVKLFVASAGEDPVTNVALSTDGLRFKALDDLQEQRPFERFFRDSWAYATRPEASSQAIEAFLLDVEDQSGDDKTLVLAVSAFEGEPGEAERLTSPPPREAASAGEEGAEDAAAVGADGDGDAADERR